MGTAPNLGCRRPRCCHQASVVFLEKMSSVLGVNFQSPNVAESNCLTGGFAAVAGGWAR